MSNTELPATVQRLAAVLRDENAPRLGVHTMSEFMFCQFAGVIAVDQQQDEDRGSECHGAPALGGLPTHDLPIIRYELEKLSEVMKWPVAWNLGLAMLIVGLTLNGVPEGLFLLPALYFSLRWNWQLLQRYSALKKRLWVAEHAKQDKTNWTMRVVQEVNWWELIGSGFESIEKVEPLFDPSINLAGKPWRVLLNGSRQYPVLPIRVREGEYDERRQGKLRSQQFARIAAYAYLLNKMENAESDWAIVLFGKSDEGIAIPLTQEIWKSFEIGLPLARTRRGQYVEGTEYLPKPWLGTNPCAHCPHGNLKDPKEDSYFQGVPVVPYLTETPDGRRQFHSTCGDRFRWTPPHENAKKLGLMS